MSPELKNVYEEQNRRDYITAAKLGTAVSIPLNLLCSVMDYCMYPGQMQHFFVARLGSSILVALAWLWFRNPQGSVQRRIFGVTWYASPLAIIIWMIYITKDPYSPYYAGLNIVLLAIGLISPWTYIQNLLTTVFVLIMYVIVELAIKTPQHLNYVINNATFLLLTAVLVVAGSVANSRQRLREFTLRFELDINRKSLEENNRKLIELDRLKSRFFANVSHEMRTPLTLLLSPLETLAKRYAGLFDQNTQEMLQTMQNNGMRLLKLINDLLELIRLESGRL
jgi:signal transduction histidine kinase